MVDACLELKSARRLLGRNASCQAAGAGSTMPVTIGCVGAPLMGASISEAVHRMGVRSAATPVVSPISAAMGAVPASFSVVFSHFFTAIRRSYFRADFSSVAVSREYSRFAECAAPRTVRSARNAGRQTRRSWRDRCVFSLREQGDARETVHESLVSHETGSWQRTMIHMPPQS